MNGRFILISGSASRDCPHDKLETAIRFVESFTEGVLKRGGGIVVLAGVEDSSRNAWGTPLIFDWVALRSVETFAQKTTINPRPYARVVMSDQAPENKIDDANLQLLAHLEQRNVLEITHIKRELYTGGAYRDAMTDLADAMVALGGGRGTYSAGTAMTDLDKPVLPLDLDIGAIAEDGQGAVALHREMMSDTERFLPNTHAQVKNRMGLFSLNRGVVEPETAALAVAEIISDEFEAGQPEPWQPARTANPLRRFGLVLKELPLAAAAIRIFEFLRNLLPFAQP